MTKDTLYWIGLFVFLVLLQVLILNNVLLFGYVNPYLYISFVFFFPLQKNRIPILSISFLLGLCIDFFSDSGGIHAFATLFITYVRPFFVQLIFKKTKVDFPLFSIKQEPSSKKVSYIVTLTFLHHFLLFALANFSFKNLIGVFSNTFLSVIFTLLLFFLGTSIFSKRKL